MSNETKWTKGPWRYTKHGCVKGGEFHKYQRGEAQQQVALATARDDNKQEANAHLIAAAPDLYEALDELADLMRGVIEGDYKPDSFTLQIAKAALAKARGES